MKNGYSYFYNLLNLLKFFGLYSDVFCDKNLCLGTTSCPIGCFLPCACAVEFPYDFEKRFSLISPLMWPV